MSLRFPDRPFSATEWRLRWKATGVFMEEPGEPMHTCVWWSMPRFCVAVEHTAYGHEAGGKITLVTIERVIFREVAQRASDPSPRTATWREGDLDALGLDWLPSDVRPVIAKLFEAAELAAAPAAQPGGTIGKGDRVRVVSGKNRGREGVVFWLGPSKFGPGERVGIEITPSEKIWSTRDAIERAGAEAAPHWTALHEACDRGHIERIEQLLRAGADVSARAPASRPSATMRRVVHEAGSTPLHVAVFLAGPSSHVMVSALLAAGADVNAVDDTGASAADRLGSSVGHAGSTRFAKIVPLLAAAGARFDGAAIGALRHGDGVVLLALAEAGFDFDRPLQEGASLRARLEQVHELQWKKKRTVLNAAARNAGGRPAS